MIFNKKIDFKKFPSTRYQGSKRKILPWFYKHFKEIQFENALDVFGGSAVVSYLFKRMNKSVTYNDYLKFNYLIGKALIENRDVTLNNSDVERILASTSLTHGKVITKHFKDVFFKPDENIWLDNTTLNIYSLNHCKGNELEYKKALAFYALFQACLIKRPFNLFHRKNLKLRTNNVKRTFGNFKNWERSFTYYFREFIDEVNNCVFDNNKECFAMNKDVFDLEENYDLVYIDPPYFRRDGRNETSNYINSYHFLEGIARYDEWLDLIDYNTINNRFKTTQYSNFTHKTIEKNIEQLVDKFRNSIIVFSYKNAGYPSIRSIMKLLKKFKKQVYTRSINYSYALNGQNGNKIKNREVLIIGL